VAYAAFDPRGNGKRPRLVLPKIAAERPNSVSLAMLTASSTLPALMMETTGPKLSSE